jgi:hypothetical protein
MMMMVMVMMVVAVPSPVVMVMVMMVTDHNLCGPHGVGLREPRVVSP